MGVKFIHRNELTPIQTPVHEIRVYIDDESLPQLSITEILRQEPYDWSESKEKSYFYYILEGQGKFYLNDEVFSLTQGDIFVVSPQSKYRTPVGVKLLAITTPRFGF
jgi:mannose-6-phosphate isomerase-like protein (cupin superfamily)